MNIGDFQLAFKSESGLWAGGRVDGVELEIVGDSVAPDSSYLALAQSFIKTVDTRILEATDYLKAFVKDCGAWNLEFIVFGSGLHNSVNPMQAELLFRPSEDPYGLWSVGFIDGGDGGFNPRQFSRLEQ